MIKRKNLIHVDYLFSAFIVQYSRIHVHFILVLLYFFSPDQPPQCNLPYVSSEGRWLVLSTQARKPLDHSDRNGRRGAFGARPGLG